MRLFGRFSLAIVLSSAALSSCIPLRVTILPEREGYVFDAQTGAPIPGAKVDVCRVRAGLGSERFSCSNSRDIRRFVTDSSGHYKIPRQRATDIFMLGATHCSGPTGNVRILKDGYEIVELRWNKEIGDPNYMDIRLKRL